MQEMGYNGKEYVPTPSAQNGRKAAWPNKEKNAIKKREGGN